MKKALFLILISLSFISFDSLSQDVGDTVFYDERIEFTILDADEKSIKQIQVKIKTGELT